MEPKLLDRTRIVRAVTEASLRAGIVKTIGPHTLRHAVAMHLPGWAQDIRTVQELVGH